MLVGKSGEIAPERMKMLGQSRNSAYLWMCLVVKVKSDTGAAAGENPRQEMARVKINILGISDLDCIGMGDFNFDDHYMYYCGQEFLRRNGVAIMVNKRLRNAVLGCNLKNDRMIS